MMKFWSDSFLDGGYIPAEYALGAIDPATHVTLSGNKNPHLAWSDLPSGTKSLVVICHDPDVPSRGDDVNREGRSVPPDLPRVDFFHWTMVDLPTDSPAIAAAEFSEGVTSHGKPGPEVFSSGRTGLRHGINDYTGWFAGDAAMAGDYYGYDGPCPPWNDTIVHRYVFTLYALNIARIPVNGRFSGPQVREAMRGAILAEARIVGIYSLNPEMARLA
jgi:Raf kinase inhibitor-like YbhB/YbcL family protein